MTATALDQTEFIIVVIGVLVIALLLYRIFKGEPSDRIVRFGIFIERARYEENGEVVEPNDRTTEETQVWPRRRDP